MAAEGVGGQTLKDENDAVQTCTSVTDAARPVPLDDEAAAFLIARIEGVPQSLWHIRARVVMGSATFFDAFNALSIAFVLPVLAREWHLTSPQIGIIIGASYLGQVAGALGFSWAAQRWGRIPCAAAATAIFALMSLACAAAPNFEVLFTCRLLQGIGVGGEMPVAAVYISELSQARGRGRFFLLYEMIFPIGLMATGQAAAVLVPLFGWQTMFLIGGVPGLVIALLLLRLPESPRWLIGRGRLADAEAVIRQMEAASQKRNAAQVRVERHAKHVLAPVSVRPKSPGSWSELLSPQFRSRTLIVWLLWASAFLIANSLNNWMPSLYTTIYGLPLQEALRAASLTNVAQVALLLCCALVIDRTGRKYWMMSTFGLGAVLLSVLAFVNSQPVMWVIILTTLSYGLIGSNNAVVYLYTPEIYPTRLRAIGTGVATSWLRIASAAGPSLIGFMLGTGGVHSVFLLFSGVALIGLIASSYMIETRNMRLEEIAH